MVIHALLALLMQFGLHPLSPTGVLKSDVDDAPPYGVFLPILQEVNLAPVTVQPDGGSHLSTFDLVTRGVLSFNDTAPSQFTVDLPPEWGGKRSAKIVETTSVVETKAPSLSQSDISLSSTATIYYCTKDKAGICLVRSFRFNLPMKIVLDGPAHTTIQLPAQLPTHL